MQDLTEALDDLGLSAPPKPRWETGGEFTDVSARELINFKKALACVDPLDTAAFEHYIPNGVVIDQAIDTRSFTRGWSRAILIPTDVPIPTGPLVERAIGIGAEPNARNHYLFLAVEVKRHYDELGANAMGPPLVFRTGGGNGTRALLGVIMKFDLTPPDGQNWSPGASWGLVGEKRMPRAVAENESEEKQLGLN